MVAWNDLNRGYRTSQFYTVAIDPDSPGNDIIIGGMQDNGTWWTNTTDGNVDWLEQLGGDGSFCAIGDASGSRGTYFFSYQLGIAYRFRVWDTGSLSSWTRVDPIIDTEGGEGYLFINPFIVDAIDRDVLYLGFNQGVWRNDDTGQMPLWNSEPTLVNWTRLTTEPANRFVTALTTAEDGSRSLFYGAENGGLYEVPNANTAAANTTPALINGESAMVGAISGIALDPGDSDRLLVGISNYNVENLWYTEDRGVNWASVEGNLGGTDSPSVRDVAIIDAPGAERLYLAATSTGLYSTFRLDGADTIWRQEAVDLIGNTVVDMIEVRPVDGLVGGRHPRQRRLQRERARGHRHTLRTRRLRPGRRRAESLQSSDPRALPRRPRRRGAREGARSRGPDRAHATREGAAGRRARGALER